MRRLGGSAAQGLMAGCVYLAFFCTFRYGRPYLTSAAESFWFGLPMFWLLALRMKRHAGRSWAPGRALMLHLLMGLVWGLGAAYKSFALIAPAAAAWWCAALASEPQLNWRLTFQDHRPDCVQRAGRRWHLRAVVRAGPGPGRRVGASSSSAKNAAKLGSGEGYWHTALHGGSSIWAQLLA